MNDGVDGAGAGWRLYPFEGSDVIILEQAIEHAPGEGAVGAAALQREVDDLLAQPRRVPCPLNSLPCSGRRSALL